MNNEHTRSSSLGSAHKLAPPDARWIVMRKGPREAKLKFWTTSSRRSGFQLPFLGSSSLTWGVPKLAQGRSQPGPQQRLRCRILDRPAHRQDLEHAQPLVIASVSQSRWRGSMRASAFSFLGSTRAISWFSQGMDTLQCQR